MKLPQQRKWIFVSLSPGSLRSQSVLVSLSVKPTSPNVQSAEMVMRLCLLLSWGCQDLLAMVMNMVPMVTVQLITFNRRPRFVIVAKHGLICFLVPCTLTATHSYDVWMLERDGHWQKHHYHHCYHHVSQAVKKEDKGWTVWKRWRLRCTALHCTSACWVCECSSV